MSGMNNNFENLLVAMTPGGIEAQEARGQRDLVSSQRLPRRCPKADLEALGFKFAVQSTDGDDLFWGVEYPSGWSMRPTDHSMWSELIDPKGRRRAGIFYKAAFYDRSAHMNLDQRYGISRTFDDGPVVFFVRDFDGTRLHSADPVDSGDWTAHDAARKECEDWLTANYPNWESPRMYWD